MSNRFKPVLRVALTSLALVSGGNIFGQVTISTFDSDLSAFTADNFWHAGLWSTPPPTWVSWKNESVAYNAGTGTYSSNPGGSMWVGLDWDTSTSGWQDRKIEADATPWPGYDLRQYPTIEFDARVLPGVSQQTEAGLQVVGQGWDGAGDNMNVQWTVMANLQLSTSWTHYSISTLAFPHYLNRLTLNAFEYGSYPSAHTELEFDNITLIPVPEPSVAGLLALGFVTVLLGRRRQA